MLSLSIDTKLDYSTPIYFVPLGIATTNIKTAPAPTKTNMPPKKIATTKPVVPITPAKKPTTVAAAIPKKKEPKKEIPPATKKTEEIKEADVKKTEPIKQEVLQKTAEPIKPKPIAQASSCAKASSYAEATKDRSEDRLDTEQQIVPIIPENAHISHNYREAEALRKQAQLQKELVQTWKPPIGVSPNCICEVAFFVSSKGKIENIKMIQSSGVMMFDISVRQALFAMKMPQWTYGKPFTISFKQ
ncbi:MAG TPA: TonB C-terminal domain-containing protein [Candidatus Babeliales bacterium]|jgi:outer membrane biosynthesis protein TonB|nr:TonB C-terminal domain-containing protein [Candidatus Babeliales bacterium]